MSLLVLFRGRFRPLLPASLTASGNTCECTCGKTSKSTQCPSVTFMRNWTLAPSYYNLDRMQACSDRCIKIHAQCMLHRYLETIATRYSNIMQPNATHPYSKSVQSATINNFIIIYDAESYSAPNTLLASSSFISSPSLTSLHLLTRIRLSPILSLSMHSPLP